MGSSQLGSAQLGSMQLGGAGETDLVWSPTPATLTYAPGTPIWSTGFLWSPTPAVLTYVPGTPTWSYSGTITWSPTPATLTYAPGTPVWSIEARWEPTKALLVYRPGTPVWSTVRTTFSGTGLFIGDTQFEYEESSMRFQKTLSGPWSGSCNIFYRGGTRPQENAEVAFFFEGVKRFGGLCQNVTEQSIKGDFTRSLLTVRFTGYSALLDRVHIAKLYTIPMGALPAIILFDLIQNLAQFGVTQTYPQGPSLNVGVQLFHYISLTECVNRIKDACPGYDWWIDDNKAWHFALGGGGAGSAPFTLRDPDQNVDEMSVTTDTSKFRNKQNVLPSADLFALMTDTSVATAGQTNVPTTYALNTKPLVFVDGLEEAVTVLGDWDGSPWYFIVGGVGVFRSPGAPALVGGEVVDIQSPIPFPVAVTRQDDASIAAVGLFEQTYQAKNVNDVATAEQVAQGLLDLYGTDGDYPQTVVFAYNSKQQPEWVVPGMSIDIDRTFPTALGIYAIERVDSQEQGFGDEQRGTWRHTVTCRKGLGDVTDAQALEEGRTSARVGVGVEPFRVTLTVAGTISGLDNPGAIVGPIDDSYLMQTPGVFESWDIQAVDDAPVGDAFILDILVNGVSIFAAGDGNKIVLPDGVTALTTGIKFRNANLNYDTGDRLTAEVLQVGSDNPGSNYLVHINVKPRMK